MSEKNHMSQWALKYAKRNWYVFPLHSIRKGQCTCGNSKCTSQGKHPRTINGLNDASVDEQIIKRWWTQWPDANIGIATGKKSNLSVLDIDPRHGGDISIKEIEATATTIVETGGGGEHLYYTYDPRIQTRAGIKPGLDFRSDGGYVVAPPSNHISGRNYVWCNEFLDFANPPEWMFGQRDKKVERIPEVILEGQRNTTLASLAGSMRSRGASQEAIEAGLQAENSIKCQPPLEQDELLRIVKSISRYSTNTVSEHFSPIEGGSDEGAEIKGFGFCAIGEIKIPRAKWLIEEVLIENGLVFISGKPKVGKTTFILSLMLKISTGQHFLNKYKTKKVKCLYFGLEDHLGEFKDRAKHMLKGEEFPKDFLVSGANFIDLKREVDFKKLEQDVVDSKAKVLIVDTFRRSHTSEENSSSEMVGILGGFRKLIRKYSITIILIHHAGHKIDCKDNPGAWLRGTSDFNGSWEGMIGLETIGDDKVKMHAFHKYRAKNYCKYNIQYSEDLDKTNNSYPIIDLNYLDFTVVENKDDNELVLSVLEGCAVSGNELQKKLKGQLSRPKIDEILGRLEKNRVIKKEGKGNGVRWKRV